MGCWGTGRSGAKMWKRKASQKRWRLIRRVTMPSKWVRTESLVERGSEGNSGKEYRQRKRTPKTIRREGSLFPRMTKKKSTGKREEILENHDELSSKRHEFGQIGGSIFLNPLPSPHSEEKKSCKNWKKQGRKEPQTGEKKKSRKNS